MEIEAKFVVPNEETYQRLLWMKDIAGYTLGEAVTTRVKDRFLDTEDRRLDAVSHILRRRESEDGIVMTLKGVTRTENAIHSRDEYEIILLSDIPVSQWPEGDFRTHTYGIIREAPLLTLFEQEQTRVKRRVTRDGEDVGEWSLDEVTVHANDQTLHYYELEIEFTTPDAELELDSVVRHIQKEWGLVPQLLSKYERGIKFVNLGLVE